MWSNAAKEVKKLDNPLAQARGEANAKRGKEKTRQARVSIYFGDLLQCQMY